MFIQAVRSFSIVSCFCPSVAEAPSPFRRVPVDGVTRQRQGIVHGAGGAPREAQVLSAGRAMAALTQSCLQEFFCHPAGSMFDWCRRRHGLGDRNSATCSLSINSPALIVD